ncbi:MAG: sigma-70 family RNA polymerase sigma factor [Planctomycetes bacterium]|nr:sigma-70 family RNA polymerase sigma factor [Planctomycetota bacterium]
MTSPTNDQVSLLVRDLETGDEAAIQKLLPLIYDDLRSMARGLYRGNPQQRTLQPTALVHEAFVRLVGGAPRGYQGRLHFMRVAALAMRQLLTDYARERAAQKRGGNQERVTIGDLAAREGEASEGLDALALEEALAKLGELHPRQARVVELRFLTGLSIEETAEALGIAPRTARFDWQMARAWLTRFLRERGED